MTFPNEYRYKMVYTYPDGHTAFELFGFEDPAFKHVQATQSFGSHEWVRNMEKFCENGNAGACRLLGNYYYIGYGKGQAKKYYFMSAKLGYPLAIDDLNVLLFNSTDIRERNISKNLQQLNMVYDHDTRMRIIRDAIARSDKTSVDDWLLRVRVEESDKGSKKGLTSCL